MPATSAQVAKADSRESLSNKASTPSTGVGMSIEPVVPILSGFRNPHNTTLYKRPHAMYRRNQQCDLEQEHTFQQQAQLIAAIEEEESFSTTKTGFGTCRGST